MIDSFPLARKRGAQGARWYASLLVLTMAGCQKPADIVWVDGAETAKLADEQAPLQDKIRAAIRKHCGTPQSPKLLGAPQATEARLLRGQHVYQQRCAACHGDTGDGKGPVAQHLSPRPRDYRKGVFKFTSTYTGSRPLRSDLLQTMRRGIRGTSMPSFAHVSTDDLEATIDYVLALSRRGELETLLAAVVQSEDDLPDESVDEQISIVLANWIDAPANVVLTASVEPPYSEESLALGRRAFADAAIGCVRCHGADGRGKMPANVEGFDDAWGFKTRAADLTSGMLRGGAGPADIYRRIVGGINGTPMPTFKANVAIDPDVAWHLVHYVQHVSNVRRRESAELAAEALPPAAPAATPGPAPEAPANVEPADGSTETAAPPPAAGE